MRVTDISVIAEDTFCELSAAVHFETHWVWGDQPFRLWYRFAATYTDYLSAEIGDAFVAALLGPAMRLNERLEIDADVSPKLRQATGEIQAIYRDWHRLFEVVDIMTRCAAPKAKTPSARGKGLFFSLGVDSCYSLLKSLERQDGEDRVSHLINVLGFDIYLWESQSHLEVQARLERLAKELGIEVVIVTTNLREMSDRIVAWDRAYHGAALASVALSLPALFREVIIAASQTYGTLRPWGSHPLVDPLWSTEQIRFVHDGCEASRFSKIRRIATAPWALQALRVCAADVTEGFNCGRCDKCIKTQLGLYVAGVLEACSTLPSELDLCRIAEIVPDSAMQCLYFRELIDNLNDSHLDRELKETLELCLSRSTA